MKQFFRVFTLVLAILAVRQSSMAQVIAVSVNVTPPYSSQAKDYVQQGNNVSITLINGFSIPKSVKLLPSLTGINNGMAVKLRDDYTPAAPIVLGPGQSKIITLNQLKAYNTVITPGDIIVQGMTKEDYFNGKALTEGLYKVCVKVVADMGPAGGGGGTYEGCGTFNIQAYDAPIILNPMDKSTVKPLTPQFMNFSWTPSGQVGKTKYTIKIADLTATNVFNPNDAFNGNVLPFFQQNTIPTTSFIMDQSKPKLKEGNKYAVEITAYDPDKKLNYKNHGRSPVVVFTYKNELGLANNPPPANNDPKNNPPNGACISPTKWQGITQHTNQTGIANGTDIAVGFFVMKNTNFTSSNGSYTGTGEILVNFLHTKLKVQFSGIKIGSDNRMYEGKITAMAMANAGISDAMSKDRTGTIESSPDIQQLQAQLETNSRDVKNLNELNAATDLPVHFTKHDQRAGFVGMIFETTEAYANMAMVMEVTQAVGDNRLLFAAKGIPVHPNGYAGADNRLGVSTSQVIYLSENKMSMRFLNENIRPTYARVDCDGFKEFVFSGLIQVDRSLAIPFDKLTGKAADANKKLEFSFHMQGVTELEGLLMDHVDANYQFAIPGARDFLFDAKMVRLDLSSDAKFDEVGDAYKDLKGKKDWIGIYIKKVDLILPKGFKAGGILPYVAINGEDMIIGKQGIRYERTDNNVLKDGNIAGWGLNISKVELKIKNSKLEKGSMEGDIALPIGEHAEMEFEATISEGGEEGAEIEMSIKTKDEIEADLFLAKIKLDKGSTVEMTKKDGHYGIKAELNGEIGISFDKKPSKSNVSTFELPKLKFEELTIEGKDDGSAPTFDMKVAEMESQGELQAKIGAFELKVDDIKFKKNGDRVGLGFTLGLSLFGGESDAKNGAGATTTFTIWAKWQYKKLKYDESHLDGVSIKADMGVAFLEGSLEIFNQDEVYGNGFRGSVEAKLNGLGAKIGVTLQLGRTLPDHGNYKYFYFDAMAEFGVGLNIPGTVASIYGFGGGAWCNMKRSGGKAEVKPGSFKVSNKGGDEAPTKSGATFVPSKDDAGFFAAVMFGITGSKTAFNGDLKFSMAFNSKTMAVNNVMLEGHAYLMQNPANLARRDPDKAFLYCEAKIEYDRPTNKISGNFGAHINVLEILKGSGEVAFMFDMPDKDKDGNIVGTHKTKWHVMVGHWTAGKDPFEDPARLNIKIGFDAKVAHANITFETYFMIGNDLPSTMPPIPDYIYELVKDEGMEKTKPLPDAVSNEQNLAIAFGAGIKISAGFDFFVIKADLEAAAGFDVLLSNINAKCDGTEIGVNGWYAQGQAWAYLHGDLKLFRKITVAEFIAGAVFQVKLPNPNWVRGDIYAYIDVLGIDAGEYHGTFEKGEVCENMKTEFKPFENIKLIKSVTPVNDAKDVSPFTNSLLVKLFMADGLLMEYNAFYDRMDMFNHYTEIKMLDKDNKPVDYDLRWDGNTPWKDYRLALKGALEGNSTYTIIVDSWISDGLGGKAKKEHVEVKFKTGERPKSLSIGDLYKSYPFPNQRYFMKKNQKGEPERGLLAMRKDLDYIFDNMQYNQPSPNAGQIKPFVRFIDVASGAYTDVPVANSYTSSQYSVPTAEIRFDIPQTLKNSTIYEMQVVKKLVSNNNIVLPKLEYPVFKGLYFRTSRYNNFKEKIDAYSVKKVGYLPMNANFAVNNGGATPTTGSHDYFVPVILLEGAENFDRYEMFTYEYNIDPNNDYSSSEAGRLISLVDNGPASNWVSEQRQKHVYPNGNHLTKSEGDFFYSITKTMASDWRYVTNPEGFPFKGIRTEAMSIPGTVQWMQNIQKYEQQLKARGDLSGNESIRRPDNPLSADEIEDAKGGGGGFKGPSGMSSGANVKQYSAIMDMNPLMVNYALWKIKVRLMNAAMKVSVNDFWKMYNVQHKLGWADYKKQNYDIQMIGVYPGGGSGELRTITYKYDPK